MQPFKCRMCKTKHGGCSFEARFQDGARSMSFAFLAITPTNTLTLERQDNGALLLMNV